MALQDPVFHQTVTPYPQHSDSFGFPLPLYRHQSLKTLLASQT